ncbi:fungal pheromone STE3G-protein-coupled receptor [Peniophora sp. CONT]|nr:fungal pheromone STE3G-protein-coupled receptor [Peniophora sp. CONT]
MAAIDPTFPLYSVACILAAALLLLLQLSSLVRQNNNLGISFLCFWAFFENLFYAVNTIVWSDNADIKLDVYCDIVTHVMIISYVVKPLTTLTLMRRLYLIASLRDVDLSAHINRRDRLIGWMMGLVLPVLVAGPVYYTVQGSRFEVLEGFGCRSSPYPAILATLLIYGWLFIPPLVSVFIYYPRVLWLFYRQNREINRYLNSNTSASISRMNYLRILALASIDVVLTLPIGITTLATSLLPQTNRQSVPFYRGWKTVHSDWTPQSITYVELKSAREYNAVAWVYIAYWTSPMLAFAIFGLFGLTQQARETYWRALRTVAAWCRWDPSILRVRHHSARMDRIDFTSRVLENPPRYARSLLEIPTFSWLDR